MRKEKSMKEERKRMYEIKKIEAVLGELYCNLDKQLNRLNITDKEVERVAFEISNELHDLWDRYNGELWDFKQYMKRQGKI